MAWFGADKISNGELQDLISRGFQQFLPARVVSIDQSEKLTNGNIVAEIVSPLATTPNQQKITAFPLFANIKTYPLVNEVVFLVSGPSGDYSSNSSKVKYYYLSTLNIWNSIHVNPTPNPYENLKPSSQNKSIAEVEAGSTNKSDEVDTNQFKPGTYFTEKSNIYPLYPFEGDIIYEGRFGNSIRLGSTDIANNNNTPISLNNWSVSGSNGDPILIFRNGQNPELKGPAQNTIIEDINKDLSSIYITSTQQIPLVASSQNDYLSYGENKPSSSNQYSGAQIILNSGRLVFNTTQDHLMFSSKKSINLNSIEGINVDTVGPVVIEAPEIKLGSNDAEESVLLGDSTVDLLQNLISDLVSLTKIMGSQIGNNGILLEPTATTARTISNNLSTYQSQLDSLKSNIVKVE
jgi:hypothetical protein